MGEADEQRVAKGVKIIVVDDSVSLRRLAAITLKKIGYSHVIEAKSGEDGLNTITKISPTEIGAVLLDMHMPGMSGIDVLKKLRKLERYKDIPVVMLTSEAHQPKVVEAAKAGADGYMLKPVTTETLAAKLEKVMQRRNN